MRSAVCLLALLLPSVTMAFAPVATPFTRMTTTTRTADTQLYQSSSSSSPVVRLSVELPPANSDRRANMKIEPCLDGPSEMIQVRYRVPFELSVEPQKNLAICTKDGPGGEKVGDVLRYTSQWTLGLPEGDGLMTTAAAFSGGLKWGCTMFDVLKAKSWEQVVEALLTNTQDRTDEVVLIFERPLSE